MKYLKRYNEHENLSIFGEEWKKLLPKKLTIITQNGEFELVNSTGKKNEPDDRPDIVVNGVGSEINAYYYQKAKLPSSEPDSLSIDMYLNKNENGIKILVSIIYGESSMSEFSLEAPNKVDVIGYDGIGSLYDPKSFFAFTDESIKELIYFFNSFNNGLKLTTNDFTFLDNKKDSYVFNNAQKGQDEERLKNSLNYKETNPIQKFENYEPIVDDVKKILSIIEKKYKVTTNKINIGEEKEMNYISVNDKSIPLSKPFLRKSYAINKIYFDVKDKLKEYSESSVRRAIREFINKNSK